MIWAMLEHDLAQAFRPSLKQPLFRCGGPWKLCAPRVGMTFTSWLANVADLLGRSDHIAAGLDLIAEALTQIEPTGERFWEAEVCRVKGDLLLQRDGQLVPQGSTSEAEAETCYGKAIEIARAESAKSLELRATMSLARLRR